MKRVIALILCLLLAVSSLTAAFASTGDKTLKPDDADETFWINSCVVTGDTVYVVTYNGIYSWTSGAEGLTKLTDTSVEQIVMENFKGESISLNNMGLISYNGDLCALVYIEEYDPENMQNMEFGGVYLVRLAFGDEQAAVEPVQLDWDMFMEYYDDYSYPVYPNEMCTAGDTLYMMAYVDGRSGLYGVPLDGGYAFELDDSVTNIECLTRYKGDQLLFLEYDYNDGTKAYLKTYDPESELVSGLCEMEIENYSIPQGIAYSEKTDRIYYCAKGSLIEFDPATGNMTSVNDIAMAGTSVRNAGIMDDGFYAAALYDGVVIKNTDPSQRSEKSLRIYDTTSSSAIRNAYSAYTNDHGNVSVGIASDYVMDSSITEAMLNRSADYDIYVVSCEGNAFSVCLDRGYMAELEGNAAIKEFFDRMYPDIAACLSRDGSVCAVPVYTYGSGFGVNNEALEATGLTIEDIPTDWVSFINWLPECAAKVADTDVAVFDAWYSVDDFKVNMFYYILEDYMKYLDYTGREQGYNTEIFYNALKALEDLDVSCFGFRESTANEEDEEDFWNTYNWETKVLFSGYVDQLANGYADYATPITLSMSEDAPFIIELDMYAAFVNPFSASREEAVEYLGYVVNALEKGQLANLDPNANEPVRPVYYEENMRSVLAQLEYAEQYLAECTPEEKQDAERYLEEMQREVQYFEEQYWEVSPKAIQWYRDHDDNLVVGTYNPLYFDNNGEIYDYISKYFDGSIELRAMLEGIDKKVQMIYLEGN